MSPCAFMSHWSQHKLCKSFFDNTTIVALELLFCAVFTVNKLCTFTVTKSLSNRPVPSYLLPLCQNEASCKTFPMKLRLICMKMNIQYSLFFITMVLHKNSF